MEVAVGSELGIWQKQQSDAHVAECIAPNVTFLGVADGFGFAARGTSTAMLALGTVRDYLRRRQRLGALGARSVSQGSMRALLLSALDHANARLFAQSGSHEDFVGSGTSLTAVLVVGHHAFIGHVGDARAYLLRVGHVESLTVDDAMFADAAVTSMKGSVPAKPRTRSLLWRSLGTQTKLEASIAQVELIAGDQLLLCTDGIHRCVDADELGEAMQQSPTAADAVSLLLSTVRARGNVDNATLIVGRDLLVPTLPSAGRDRLTEIKLRALIALLMLATALVSFGIYVLRFAPVDRAGILTTDR